MPEPVLALCRALEPGSQVYLPGSAAEVAALSQRLATPDAPPLHITQTFIPGINPTLAGKLPPGSSWTGPFASGPRGAQAGGLVGQLPCSYAGFRRHLERSRFDVTVVHVAPPQRGRLASLGPAVEFTPIAVRRSMKVVAVVNPAMPVLPHADTIDLDSAALVVELEQPLREYDVGSPTSEAVAIAGTIANLIDDGATIQIGLGKIPDALLSRLTSRRRLRLHSGMLSDGTRTLFEAGALDVDHPHTSCVHVGTASYYRWLAGQQGLHVRSCDQTHAPEILAAQTRLVAVNSAMTVDLFGAANLETLDGRAISGVGGAADFARAASLSPEGLSIVALPAASADGTQSRIVPALTGPASLPRHDVDVVITEYGVADLRGATVTSRANRLLGIAHPAHRAALAEAWYEIAKKL